MFVVLEFPSLELVEKVYSYGPVTVALRAGLPLLPRGAQRGAGLRQAHAQCPT
ncbi:MAG: hypothetical protein WKG07_33100 [Hymenobacter sp.]